MKNNIFFRQKIYSFHLGEGSLQELFDSGKNNEVLLKNLGIIKIISKHIIVMNRLQGQRGISSAHIQLNYNPVREELCLSVRPIRGVYIVHLAALYIFGSMVSKGGGKSIETYIIPLSMILFVSLIMFIVVLRDFNDISKIIESTIEKP